MRSPGARRDLDQVLRGVESVKLELRDDRVAIGRKRRFLDEHAVAFAVGPEEAHHHQVQIHGQRIHGDDFGLAGADQSAASAAAARS